MAEDNPPAADTANLSPGTDENIFINLADGLPNQHPIAVTKNISATSIGSNSSDDESLQEHRGLARSISAGLNSNDNNNEDDLLDDLPTSLIVTNIHSEVFTDEERKTEMEEIFRQYSPAATFHWLKSFKRLRVYYDIPAAAAAARLQLHQYEFHGSFISCYFAQPVTPVSHKNLQPPAPVKQFLISPPASPPAGWEPREECEPLVNHDLLAALANLSPGESHEVHHPESESQPSIVVHTALAAVAGLIGGDGPGKIVQTKCPERT